MGQAECEATNIFSAHTLHQERVREMAEAVFVGTTKPGCGAALRYGRCSSGVSAEAVFVEVELASLVRTMAESVVLFGRTSTGISKLKAVISEASQEPDQSLPSIIGQRQAIDLLIALPESVAMPDFTLDPDGCISLDWVASRSRMLSVGVGDSNRLAYAWIDGTDRGHAGVKFDGQRVPAHLMAILLTFRSGSKTDPTPV